MSTPVSADQPTTSRDWGYPRGWRRFSVIVVRPPLMAAMKYRWQGQENFPQAGETDPGPA